MRRLGLEQTAFRECLQNRRYFIPSLILENRVAKQGTPSEGYERETWPELEKLARDVPEAGLHFQGARGHLE